MSQIPRRGFLASLAAMIAAPFLPTQTVAAPVVQGLAFHPDAFSFVMADLPITIDHVFGLDLSWESAEPFHASENYRKYLAADAAIQESLT